MTIKSETAVRSGRSVTMIAVVVNIGMILLKMAAGLFGRSQALIADAVHSASDLATDAIVLVGLQLGRKAPDEKHHFGHARIETMASAVVGMVLIAAALYLGIDSAFNIYRHSEYHPKLISILAAAVSVAAKETLYHYTVFVGRRIKSPLIVANAWHQRSDALSSIAVLVGVTAAYFNPAWHILDAYAALLVSFFIVKVGIDIVAKTVPEFTDAAPSSEVLKNIEKCAVSVPGVIGAHDLRVRVSGGAYQMEIHILIDQHLTILQGHRIAKAVEKCIQEEIEDTDSVIVHVDPANERPT
jgi:cation diffusion facilitator family transporter